MAINSTIYRFGIDLNDLNRNIYDSFSVHVALHPSETVERMCARVLAYCVFYEEGLEFTKGLSTENEPDLWKLSYSDEIDHWIELGKPDVKRLRKALGRSHSVTVMCYGGQDVEQWLESVNKDSAVRARINIYRIDVDALKTLAEKVARTMQLSVMVQDDLVHLTYDGQLFEFQVQELMVVA